ncbi:MAG: PilZ domain-containing protein [Loktanella sp.]|nr:PilZ domain-containing protein [Loktanella sp.]
MEYFRPFRYPAATPVSLRTPRGTVKATVIDVNDGGMRLSGRADVQPGETVKISILGIPVTGIVRWVGKDRYGVLFRPKISTRQVDALRQGVKTSQSKHARFQSYPELR